MQSLPDWRIRSLLTSEQVAELLRRTEADTCSARFDAIRKAREWMLTLPEPFYDFSTIDVPLPPRYPPEELLSLVDPDIRKPFDMIEVLIRIVDDSRISMFKPSFGSNLITAYAQIMSHNVGIIANRIPVINGDEASKGAQFIRLCNQS